MLLEYLGFLLLGVALGTVTGLTPGLHVNTVALLMLSLFPALVFGNLGFIVLLCALATTHTFLDFIPSIFLGAPEEGTVLSVLPSHQMLMEGKGWEAVQITARASLYGVLLSVPLLGISFFVMQLAYASIKPFIGFILIILMLLLLIRERHLDKIIWASFTFFASGYYGYIVLNSVSSLSRAEIFFPMFTGLFGLSTLVLGLSSKTASYRQDESAEIMTSDKGLFSASLLGTVGGLIVGVLPAFSPSQIGILFQEIFALKEKAKEKLEELNGRRFLTIVASLNTADAIFSIFALYLIGNPRSGVSVMIGELFIDMSFGLLLVCLIAIVLSGLVAYVVQLWVGKKFLKLYDRFDFRKICLFSIGMVVVLLGLFTGVLGLFIAFAGMLIGLIPALAGVSRTHAMGVLILPTIIFYL